MKYIPSIFLFLLSLQSGAQTKQELTSLIQEISEDVDSSQLIIDHKNASEIINSGITTIPRLIELFSDDTMTAIYSDCEQKYLSKGEIAIILTDRIHWMPYYTLTGIQNCLLTFCPANLNLIEFYLNAVKRQPIAEFQQKCKEWYMKVLMDDYVKYKLKPRLHSRSFWRKTRKNLSQL